MLLAFCLVMGLINFPLTALAAENLEEGDSLPELSQDDTMETNSGTIINNNGTVHTNNGTVNFNDGTIEGGTRALNNYYKLTYDADKVSVSGLTKKNGNSYILSTASVTLTPPVVSTL